ncbi:Fc receptor-like protein 5 isoform X2 [Brachyhypopomus gauderio]
MYSVDLLPDSSRGAGGSYTLSPAALHHTGVYVCRAERGEPANQTQYSNPQPLWITGESPTVSLIIRPNRTQYTEDQYLTLSCEGHGDSTGWRVRRYTESESAHVSDCSSGWGLVTGSTCTIKFLHPLDTGVYWCQSESGGNSNLVNITVHKRPRTVLSVSPHIWLNEGDSVTLSCEVRDSSTGWTFSWYKAVPYREGLTPIRDMNGYVRYYVDLLSDSSRGAGGSYTLSPAALHHTGVYVCIAEKGEPANQTQYSNQQPLWITGESPPVSLIIRPNRIHHFEDESLTLSCEGHGYSTGCSVIQYTESGSVSGYLSDLRSNTGSTCTIGVLYPFHTGVYWCESESGGSSNPVNITVHKRPRTVLSESPQSWLNEGVSVTLSCEVRDSSTGWTFSWYRAVPYKRGLTPIKDTKGHVMYSVDLLSDSSRGAGGSYTLSPAALHHTGVYVCRAERGEPAYRTQSSNLQPLWITGESPPVSLIINPNRTQHFYGDSLSLSCEGQSDSTGWGVRGYTHSGRLVDCSSIWGSISGSTCFIRFLYIFLTGVYWCQSESGGSRNPVNITVHKRLQAVLSVSPQSWLTEGVSVILSCEVRDSSTGWTFSWYRVVPYREGLTPIRDIIDTVRYSVEVLPDSSRGAGGSYTLSPAALHHTGVYVCRAKRGEPANQTQYSNLLPLWITGESPPVSLTIRPNRTQHFNDESLTLSCEGHSDSTGWRVRRYTHSESESVSDCSSDWGSVTGSTCTINFLYTSHTGVYWCQSESGGSSNPVNITVHYGSVILESPVHPVTEGDPLTLHCLLHPTVTSDLRADLYKDGLLIQYQTAGEMTIHTVSKSDEGLYHCKHPERGESPHSWVSVRGVSHSEAPFSVLGLLSNLLAASPYLLVSIILGVKCYRARVHTGENQSQNAVTEE